METIGGLLVLAGTAVIACAIYRRLKTKTLLGTPFWRTLGIGLLLFMLGGMFLPDENGGDGKPAAAGADTSGNWDLDTASKLPLASREENGTLRLSLLGATLGDVRRKLASLTDCEEKIDGPRVTLTGRADHDSKLEVSFLLLDRGNEGKAALIERLTMDLRENGVKKSKSFDSARAHLVLNDLLRQ